ncbi:hypothetical protein Naga_100034g39 [Nannochloropsis gaditana]|uniref:Uncharacterized protein n=1 Tax=Nannochloropsis gaditana TaxID=72520 RepID=W7TW44_9STRA|nr:hypothetical protein Naga_100034g39 [Nannochloropsis gaditana]
MLPAPRHLRQPRHTRASVLQRGFDPFDPKEQMVQIPHVRFIFNSILRDTRTETTVMERQGWAGGERRASTMENRTNIARRDREHRRRPTSSERFHS